MPVKEVGRKRGREQKAERGLGWCSDVMLSKKQGNEEGLGKKSAVHLAESLDQGDEEPQGRGCIEEPCVKQKLFAFSTSAVLIH